VWWSPTRAEQSHTHRTAKRSEAAEVEAELEAVLAARAAGVSPWGSELLPLFLQQLLEHLQWDKDTCRAIRATCSTWCGVHDALRPGGLKLRGWMTGMEGKLGFQARGETPPARRGQLLGSSGRAAEHAVAQGPRAAFPLRRADGGCYGAVHSHGVHLSEDRGCGGATGEWVLELGFTMLTTLDLRHCTMTDAEVLAVGTLTALTSLELGGCRNVTDVAVAALSGLTGLTELDQGVVTDVAVETLGGFTSLTELDLEGCNVTNVGVSRLSGLTGLTELSLA
jgi:hypothetical protein